MTEFHSEENRLKTFLEKGWPLSYIKPETLAKCGFFYIGETDRVQCPFCGIVIFNWQSGDEPIHEHKIHSGKCPFINGQDVGNIYIGSDPRESYGLAQAQDVCGFHHVETPEKKVDTSLKTKLKPENGPGIGFKTPQSIEFITYGSRLASFTDWPISEIISPAQLAESGFYFKGPVIDYLGRQYEDFVTCFHCGVALCQWTKEDDPWEEHKKFNSECMFLNLITHQDKTETLPELLPIKDSSPSSSDQKPIENPTPSSEPASLKDSSPSSSELKPSEDSPPSSESNPIEDSSHSSESQSIENSSPSSSESKPTEESSPSTSELKPVEESSPSTSELKPVEDSSSSEPSPIKEDSSPLSVQPIKPFKPYTWLPKPEMEDLTCGVCLDFQVGAMFYPCLHSSCPLCAASLSNCPICRSSIDRVVKLDSELSKNKISFYT